MGVLESVPFPRTNSATHLVFRRDPTEGETHVDGKNSGLWITMQGRQIESITVACGSLEAQLGMDWQTRLKS